MMKRFMFLLSFLFLVSFAFAGSCYDCHDTHLVDYHHDRYDSDDGDYYWARDYYRSSDYYYASQRNYRSNTYNRGYAYASHNDYYNSVVNRHSPRYYTSSHTYGSYGYGSHRTRGHAVDYRYVDSQDRWWEDEIYPEPSVIYVDRSDYKLQYSKTFDKYYVTRCYTVPPKGSIIYRKC